MAAPSGNSNARKGKEWFDALRKACIQRDSLPKIAEALLTKAEAGEGWAIQEVANRFDGKPAQAVELTGEGGGPVVIQATGYDEAL
jgi:hypothetical protein